MGCCGSKHEEATCIEKRCPWLNTLFGIAGLAMSIFDFSTDLINGSELLIGYMPCEKVQFKCQNELLQVMGVFLLFAGIVGFFCELILHWIWYRRNKHNINCCCFGTGGSNSSDNRDVEMMSRDMEAGGDDSDGGALGQKNVRFLGCIPSGVFVFLITIIKFFLEDTVSLGATTYVLFSTNAIPATTWLMIGMVSSLVGLWFVIVKLIRMLPWIICRIPMCCAGTIVWAIIFGLVGSVILWPGDTDGMDSVLLSLDYKCEPISIGNIWGLYSGNVTRAMTTSNGSIINFWRSEWINGYDADSVLSSVQCDPYLANTSCLNPTNGSDATHIDVYDCGFKYITFDCKVTTKECGVHRIDVPLSACGDVTLACINATNPNKTVTFNTCCDYCN